MLILCCWMFYACSLHLSFLILFASGRIILIQIRITEPLRLHFFLSIFLWKSYQILLKNVLKRGYFDEFIATCRHVILVELIVTGYFFTTQTGSFYSRFSYYIMVPFYIVTDYAARVIWKKIFRKTGFNSAKNHFWSLHRKKYSGDTSDRIPDLTRLCKVTAASGYRSEGKKDLRDFYRCGKDEIIEFTWGMGR